MNIWFIKGAENSPADKDQRLGRVGSVAKYLSENGYNVIWWKSGFSHPKKEYEYDAYTEVDLSETYKVNFLHPAVVYKKNMSIKRVLYMDSLASQFRKHANNYDKPDLILSSYPSEQLCRAAIDFGRENHVPVIIDARDEWPDIFERAFPTKLRKLGNALLIPMKKKTAKVFQNADAICATSSATLDWGLNYAGREKTDLDRSIFIGCKKGILEEQTMRDELAKWDSIGVNEHTWNLCLFSSLSKTSVDSNTMIDGVRFVHEKHPEIRLVIGGKGDDEERLREYTADLDYVYMMGYLDQAQMSSLMSISKAGMFPYRNLRDFKDGWGNKVGQYLSYGLPLLTSAKGVSKSYVEKYGCGCPYEENDPQDLANVLTSLIEHPERQQEMSQSATERFNADFEYDVVTRQFENLIKDVYNTYIMEKGR